jgi:peptidoglycan hydrolase CwlO-like protein
MEDVLTFGYGVLTCIAVFGIVYGVIQLRLIKENTEEVVDDIDDIVAKHNILQRELEDKVDSLSQSIKDVDLKLEQIYHESVEVVNERFDELEKEIDELNKS